VIKVFFLSNECDDLGLKGVFAPALVCDVCEQRIGGYGNYCYDMETTTASTVYVACKGMCARIVERRIADAGGMFGWGEIDSLPIFLKANLDQWVLGATPGIFGGKSGVASMAHGIEP